MIKSLAALAGILLLAAPALASEPTDGSKSDNGPVKEKKLCRSEQATGSIMAKRTCHTRAEWAMIDEQNERTARSSMDSMNRNRAMNR